MEPLASSHHLERVLPAAKGLSEMVTKALPGGLGPAPLPWVVAG